MELHSLMERLAIAALAGAASVSWLALLVFAPLAGLA